MGFTLYEKESLRNLVRPESETSPLRDEEISNEALDYLKSSELLDNIHDYALFPKKFFHRVNKSENIVLIKYFDQKIDVHDEIMKITSILTPTYRIQIDFGFLIINGNNPEKQEFRYVFPQRSLHINSKIHINSDNDLKILLSEFQDLDRVSLMRKIFTMHQNQSCFDKSGYRPFCLLNMVFFLAKI